MVLVMAIANVAVVRLIFYHMVGFLILLLVFRDLRFRILTISILLLDAEGGLLILDVDYFVGAPRSHLAWLSLSDVQQR